MTVPDPNSLGGPVYVQSAHDKERREIALTHAHPEREKWGIGVADLAYAIRSGRPHRASGELALSVLAAMHGILESAIDGRARDIPGIAERPAPLPADLAPDALDA